jgi:phosphoglycolate phosphatase-like HAD superfamily hydrolase
VTAGRKDHGRLVPRTRDRAVRILPALARSVHTLTLSPFRESTSTTDLHEYDFAGVRTQDNLKRFQRVPVPGSTLSPEELDDSVNRLEALIAENGRLMHEAGGKGIERLPGAKELLMALKKGGARWGICTSGTFLGVTNCSLFSLVSILSPT